MEVSADRRALTVGWDDGKESRLSGKTLRGFCPCAVCVDEWTNQRRHDPDKIPESTTIESLQPVGNYAVSLGFSDGHSTGIYTWSILRELSEAQSQA
jgi:DUF971 family protein